MSKGKISLGRKFVHHFNFDPTSIGRFYLKTTYIITSEQPSFSDPPISNPNENNNKRKWPHVIS